MCGDDDGVGDDGWRGASDAERNHVYNDWIRYEYDGQDAIGDAATFGDDCEQCADAGAPGCKCGAEGC